jgi:hypothetical protein
MPRKPTAAPKTRRDPALERAWKKAIARYRRARTTETARWDERYEVLGDILDGSLYLAAGFRTARAFLAAEAPDLSERTARVCVRVARHFDAADEERFGVWKLAALLDYLEARRDGRALPRRKLRPERQRIEVAGARGGDAESVAFADATIPLLKRAARTAGGHAAPKAPPIVKAIRAVLAEAGLPGVSVALRGGRVSLGGIAPSELHAVALALSRAPSLVL